jgi:hypothetical protein
MSLRVTNGVAIPVIVPPPDAVPASTTEHELEIDWVEQEKSEWCWAACARMVLSMFEEDVPQCDVASFLRETNCCSLANEDICNQGCNRQDILDIYNNFGVTATFLDDTVSFSKVRKEIRDRGQPVEACIEWDEGGAHVVIVFGCSLEGSVRYVKVHDPYDYGVGEVRFSELRRYQEQGDWTLTWLGFDSL